VLICGAISQPLAWLLASHRIRIIPFVTGSIEDVVSRFLAGKLPDPQMTMPGCWGRRWRSCRCKGWGWRVRLDPLKGGDSYA
jgi:predicted Fe-Mo cluster-binding NifX family protein